MTAFRLQEVGSINYDTYLWEAAAATSIDRVALTDRSCAIGSAVRSAEKAGQSWPGARVSEFDWSKIFEQYQALWSELNARRLAVENNSDELAWLKHAPAAAPSRLDPFAAFGHYRTAK